MKWHIWNRHYSHNPQLTPRNITELPSDRDLLWLIILDLRHRDYYTSYEAIADLFPSIVWG